jgi:Fur family transcriptional regulator, stress-responsive regulator
VPDDALLDAELIAALRAHGHRVTGPRLTVHRHLRRQHGHLSAEQVHSDLVGRAPSLSPATVYATLDLLAELKLIRRMSTPRGVALFDTRIDRHHHLLCRSCDAIVDVEAPVSTTGAYAAATAAGFTVEHSELQMTGLCAACARAGR